MIFVAAWANAGAGGPAFPLFFLLSYSLAEFLNGRDQLVKDFEALSNISVEQLCHVSPTWAEKIGPWWRPARKEELASLVARKSLEYIENFDLPLS
ncbi:hypothetical protein VNO78_11376 [Psophocarpus tetragonolobus]|uniref:Uncharacterized protein n=1 Tax=Psophocarpus tetragonolobus TaxID=3891 RepID=A0AAN9SP48_PSOTE